MKVLGISGKKQSGKSSFAEYLAHEYKDSCLIQSFADGLKRVVMDVFGATYGQVYGTDEQKKEILECGRSAREVLQLVGTDAMRSIDPDVWVRIMIRKIKYLELEPSCKLVVIPDVRFRNEVEAIQEYGGKVIRLRRSPFKDAHKSETELDDFTGFDAVIDNRFIDVDETNEKAIGLCLKNGWIPDLTCNQ